MTQGRIGAECFHRRPRAHHSRGALARAVRSLSSIRR
jgi:hypothetical protein